MARSRKATLLAAITVEELQFAMAAGDGAYTFKTPGPPLAARTRPISEAGMVLTDHPVNRAGIAILDALAHDPERARAALYRIMVLFSAVYADRRFKKWTRRAPDGGLEVSERIMRAIATIPCDPARPPKPKAVFALAASMGDA